MGPLGTGKLQAWKRGAQNQETGKGKSRCHQRDGGSNGSLSQGVRNREGEPCSGTGSPALGLCSP